MPNGFVRSAAAALAAVAAWVSLVAAPQGGTPGRVRTADGTELAYTASGDGPPAVLLAGGPGFSGDYMQSLASFLPGFRSIVLDQRGTGRSRNVRLDATTINLASAVADIDAVREHLQQPRIVLVGHSWGGMLAMAYAAAHPDRVRALVLIGPGGPTLEFFNYFQSNIEARLTAADREAFAFWSDSARVQRDPGRAAYERFRALLPGYVYERRSTLPILEALDLESLNPRMNELMIGDLAKNGYDLRGRLRAFAGPAMIVQGRQDPIGESTAYQIAQAMPVAHLMFVEQSGHFPWVEQPDRFRRLMEVFLAGVK